MAQILNVFFRQNRVGTLIREYGDNTRAREILTFVKKRAGKTRGQLTQ